MNITSPSIRRFRLRGWLRRLFVCPLFIVTALFVGSAIKAKAEYTFTLIADSTGPFSSFGSVASPSLNAGGTVGFFAYLDNGTSGVFKGDGGNVTTIGINLDPFQRTAYPRINQTGTVAFTALRWNGVDERILAGNGGPLITIADTAGQFRGFASGYTASINTAGTVAFWAALDTGPGGIFAGNGGTTTPIIVNSSSLGADFNFSMNEAGTLAFRTGNANRIVTFNGGVVTTIVDSSGPFNYFGSAPSLNEAGTVAFVAGIGGIDGGSYGIYKGNGGPLTTIADLSGPFNYISGFNFNQPSINNSGLVAFYAGLDAGGYGVFTGDGIDTNKVIGTGDALFGSTVTGFAISPTSLNASGQVAFAYGLTNGTTGIAVANPVPEPSSFLLVAFSLGLGLLRRGKRHGSPP